MKQVYRSARTFVEVPRPSHHQRLDYGQQVNIMMETGQGAHSMIQLTLIAASILTILCKQPTQAYRGSRFARIQATLYRIIIGIGSLVLLIACGGPSTSGVPTQLETTATQSQEVMTATS